MKFFGKMLKLELFMIIKVFVYADNRSFFFRSESAKKITSNSRTPNGDKQTEKHNVNITFY